MGLLTPFFRHAACQIPLAVTCELSLWRMRYAMLDAIRAIRSPRFRKCKKPTNKLSKYVLVYVTADWLEAIDRLIFR